MTWYPDRIPDWFSSLFNDLIWHKDRNTNAVYITFDDGPTPGVTEFVLETLAVYDFKATFFCIGECVARHPDLFQRIQDEGHSIGNHTYNHLNGWNTQDNIYIKNVDKASKVISSKLFRPPYGRVSLKASEKLRNLGYKIIMWDVLSGDFDSKRDGLSCLNNTKKHTQPGSIIVFHDSIKAEERLKNMFKEYCEFLKQHDYISKAITVT